MKIYITKNCLTKGIEELEIEEYQTIKEYCVFKHPVTKSLHLFYYDKDCFFEKSLAIVDAEKRKEKKIKSLEKQLLRLSKIKF